MAVDVKPGEWFEAGVPHVVFEAARQSATFSNAQFQYDVAADGQKFLFVTPVDPARTEYITYLTNWRAGMKR
jgi:hypothetical protein